MADWIPYETGDDPSLEVSIDVDFDGDTEFRETHPYALTVVASGFPVDDDGQPDATAVDKLFELEQRVDAACEANDAAMACTLSGEGSYRMIAYASSDRIEVPVREALEGAAFRSDVRAARDAAWSVYEKYLLRGEERERARDADLVEQMHEAGDDLSIAYDVAFMWDVADSAARDRASTALKSAGYDIEVGELDDELELYALTKMVVSPNSLAEKRAEQARILAPFDARYVDWEIFSLEP